MDREDELVTNLREPDALSTVEALLNYQENFDTGFHFTDKEADVILGYMEGHGYMLGQIDGVLYRGDMEDKQGETPRVNMMIQKLSFGKIATFDDYLKNGDEKQLGKLMDFLKSQKMGNDMVHTEDGAKVNAAMDGLIEKVGLFAMGKQSVSVDAIKENFSIDHTQAENVIKQLETIGVLGEKMHPGNTKSLWIRKHF